MIAALLQRILRSDPRDLFGGLAVTAAAAIVLGMVSIFTFRIGEGFAFSLATLSACGLVYSLGFVNRKWS